MIVSFAGFLILAILLQARFGNQGLWAAMLSFMLLRASTLALRLPRLERLSFPAPETLTPVS
jgi:MATE family multidrug resistance protein